MSTLPAVTASPDDRAAQTSIVVRWRLDNDWQARVDSHWSPLHNTVVLRISGCQPSSSETHQKSSGWWYPYHYR